VYESPFDVIVVGGGINGVGVARDCCLRGMHTLLIEAEDFASGATGASTGLIHGGPRYLEHSIHTTKMSCVDSGFIQKLAPQLLFRVPFLVPWRKSARIMPELIETFFSAYDHFTVLKGGKPHTRLTRSEVLELEPGMNPNVDGAVTFDEWGVNPFRLTYLNVQDALRNGLTVLNHTKVVGVVTESSGEKRRALGVIAKSKDADEFELRGQVIVNLTGPWAPELARQAGVEVRIRPTKGVHLVLDRRYTNVAITCDAIDGRNHMFILPHENTTLIGATDDDYFGDPREIPITEDEVEYIMDAAVDILPALKGARVVRAFAGIRPTLFERGPNESDLSRAHLIIDHEERDNLAGFVTMIGGKLAAYRAMSEECTNLIAKKLGNVEPCRTATEPLPGHDISHHVSFAALSQKFDLPEFAVARIHYRHGTETEEVLHDGEQMLGQLGSCLVCTCEPVTAAEVVRAFRDEHCDNLNDLRRRTRFGMGPCSGSGCTANGANLACQIRKENSQFWHRSVSEFLQHRFHGRRWAESSPDTAKQEDLIRSLYCLSGSVHAHALSENWVGAQLEAVP
jgi:glycerol-3-phosphate dehydrogenase